MTSLVQVEQFGKSVISPMKQSQSSLQGMICKEKSHEDGETCGKKWLVAGTCLMAVFSLSLMTCLVLFVKREQDVSTPANNICENLATISRSEYIDAPLTPFSELTSTEVNTVLQFLSLNTSLGLREVKEAKLWDNFIHLIEARVPPKAEVLDWLDRDGAFPKRTARVIVFRGNATPPMVEEYEVGNLPHPTYTRLVSTPSRLTSIPYSVRPFSKIEFAGVYRHLLPRIAKELGSLMLESYDARLGPGCQPHCLRLSMTPVSSAFLPDGRRAAWFGLTYDREFFVLHPLDLQILVDMTQTDPSRWYDLKVFYAEQYFESINELAVRYQRGDINVTRIAFPSGSETELYSSLHLRGEPFPNDGRPPPIQVLPQGNRFTVRGTRIDYMKWGFTLRVSPTIGLQLFDVRFSGERIAYEVSLQEIAVLYAGHTPVASMLYFADSAGLFGTRMRGLLKGVDCPTEAVYLDTQMFTSNDAGLRRFPLAFCIFEHNRQVVLRRHRAYGATGAFYNGLSDNVLIVRTFIAVINYDYVIDYIFHASGALEVRISSTGYVTTSFYLPDEERYGTRVRSHVTAGMHQHLFHIKADLDIAGTKNTYTTWEVKVENKSDIWRERPFQSHVQTYIDKRVKKRENEACYNYNFNTPKYLLISANDVTELGHHRSYRLIPRGMTPALLPPGDGFEPSVSWARCQMAVTRHHDDEATSSSIFSMWDARNPVVNFSQYLEDDESIVNEDLVTWVTLGTYHIPQIENVPNTATVGTQLSLFLTPFNYFPEDPSMASRDAVRVSPRDYDHPMDGAIVERYNTSAVMSCLPASSLPDDDLMKDSVELFS